MSRWQHPLITPHPSLHGTDAEVRARLLAGLLLAGLPLFLSMVLITLIAVPGFQPGWPSVALIVALLLSAYGLSRSRYYQAGAVLGQLVIILSVFIPIRAEPQFSFLLGLIALGMPVGALLISGYPMYIIIALSFGSVLLLPILVWSLPTGVFLFALWLMGFSAIIALVVGISRESDSRRLSAQLEQLRFSELQYRRWYEQASDGVLMLTTDGRILNANARAAELLDTTPEALIHTNVRELIDSSYEDRHEAAFSVALRLVSTGEPMPVTEFCFRRGDGQRALLEVSFAALEGGGRTAAQLQLILRDVSGRRRWEREHFQLERERARIEVLRRVISDVSHDLRTPLSVINTSVYILGRKLPGEGVEAQQLATIRTQVQHLTRIINDLFTMSAFGTAHTSLRRLPLNINAVAEKCIEASAAKAAERGLTLKFTPAPTPALVPIDEDQLSRALNHVLTNACTYTEVGGSVLVEVLVMHSTAQIQVHDTGIGIAEADLPYIFDPFYRADSTRPTHSGGMGLGLAIAREIVEGHDGTITVASTVKLGSTFTITLPLRAQ